MPPIFSLTCTDPNQEYVGTLGQIHSMLSDMAYLEDKNIDTTNPPTEESVIAMADIVWDLPPEELFLRPIISPLAPNP